MQNKFKVVCVCVCGSVIVGVSTLQAVIIAQHSHLLYFLPPCPTLKTFWGLVNAFCSRRNANPFKFMVCHCFGIKLSECSPKCGCQGCQGMTEGSRGGTRVTCVVKHAQTCMQMIAVSGAKW